MVFVAPVLAPIGDRALLVRFAQELSDAANVAALVLCERLQALMPSGVIEVVPNLVSVLVRYDPFVTSYESLAGEVRLVLGSDVSGERTHTDHTISAHFGGEDGPDLEAVAETLSMRPDEFIARHNEKPLRVLAVGFAPGFVYCGFHGHDFAVPRRKDVRPLVPPGSILFAAGQSAVTATPIPTGWNVIGRTNFVNFDKDTDPPLKIRGGDTIQFSES